MKPLLYDVSSLSTIWEKGPDGLILSRFIPANDIVILKSP